MREVLEKTPGVEQVLSRSSRRAEAPSEHEKRKAESENKTEPPYAGCFDVTDHPRAGDLIAVAAENAWFTYYYWLDDARAPDFARTVDIHRKPGYDPVELFLDPKIPFPKIKIAWRLLQKKLGMRMLMDMIPLGRDVDKRFARAATSGKRRLAGIYHQPAGPVGPAGSGIKRGFSNAAQILPVTAG